MLFRSDYFELGDFLPGINEICEKNGLATIFNFTSELATLKIIDVDNIESTLEFSTPVEIASLKGCSAIQNIGGTQSFARRYLYIMAFEIAESDMIDGGEIDLDKEKGNQYIDKAAAFVINKLLEETKTDVSKFLGWCKVDKVEHIPNMMLASCMKELKDKKAKIEKAQQQKGRLIRSRPKSVNSSPGSRSSVSYTHLMPYVNVPNDLSKIKTKMAFNLTKRQLVCFGSAGAVGIPAYLLTRGTLGNTGAMFLMLGIMLPAFLLAMYEKDGLPFEKVVRNIIRAKFLRPGIRAYPVSYTHLDVYKRQPLHGADDRHPHPPPDRHGGTGDQGFSATGACGAA